MAKAALFCLRRAVRADHAVLADLWRRSVVATHAFLSCAAVAEIHIAVRQVYLPGVEDLWLAHCGPGARKGQDGSAGGLRPVGFMGRNGGHVDMLFVDPAFFGCGAGRTLLRLAWERAFAAGLPLTLDVNEQNPAAVAFSRRMGFVVTGRSPVDSAGRPYPLLHMAADRGCARLLAGRCCRSFSPADPVVVPVRR